MVAGRRGAAFALVLAAVQLAAVLPPAGGLELTAFSGGSDRADAVLAGGGNVTFANLSVPVPGAVLEGSLGVSTLSGAPLSPSIDIGADGSAEWKYDGTSYGPFGAQDRFADGTASQEFSFAIPGKGEVQSRMPKGANVSSAGIDIEGWSAQAWWNASWRNRMPMTVKELAGKGQSDFAVQTLLDTRNWTLGNAEGEFRVTSLNASSLVETEVPIQVLDEINNGSKCFEAALVFAVRNLTAGETRTFYLYYNNPGASRTGLWTDFNPKLIRNRLTTQTGEGSFFGPVGNPAGASFDRWGNYWVADPMMNYIHGYSKSLGTYGVPGNDSKHFKNPNDVAVTPTGRLIVSDTGNHRVQVFEPDGTFAFTIGTTGQPGSDNTHLTVPWGVGTDNDGNIYISDQLNHRIQIFDPNGSYLSTIGSTQGNGNYQFDCPHGLYVSLSKDVYIADTQNHRVQMFQYTSGLNWAYNFTIGITGVSGSDNTRLTGPTDVSVDSSGMVYISDAKNRVQIFADKNYSGTIGISTVPGADNSHLNGPFGVAVSSAKRVFISDMLGSGMGRIQVYDSALKYVQTIGSSHWTNLAPAGASNSAFKNCTGVTADSSGRIYVSDSNNHRVQIFSALGQYQMTLGVTGLPGNDTGHFNYPRGLDVSPSGQLLVADGGIYDQFTVSSNQRVLVFKDIADAVADRTIGVVGFPGNDSVHLSQPWDVSINKDFKTSVADKGYITSLFPPKTYGQRVQIFNTTNDTAAG